ncbi:MAG: hypothetical protein RI894_1321, partial [Bacteroidota bacterium]
AATGAITAAMQAGIAPYQLSFDGSILTSSINYVYYITNVAAGAHLLTIQSTDGCQVNLPITTHCAQAVLQGIVFEDINSNGLLDATENPMPNQLIRAAQTGQTWYSVSDAQGVYSINLPSVGNDTLNAPNLSTWQTITTSPLTLTALLNDTVRTNIGIHTSPTPIDLSVQLVHENLRPGFAVPYYLYYKNTSTVIAHNVMLKLHLQGMTPNSFSCGYPHTVVNDTLIITIGDLPPSYFYNTAYVTIGIPTTTPLGLFVTSTLVIEPFTNDINSLNNTYTNYDITTGSIDPNDKHVNIEAYTFDRLSTGAFVRPSPELGYTIRFQNTGTDTAFTVRVKDTLSNFLHLPSLKLIGSSHPCTVQVNNSRVATFTFANIRLVDSTHNEPASHGFVYFTIQPNDTLIQSGTPIRNLAAIYFDYNTPVLTNEVQTTPSLFVITVPEIDPKYSIGLSPNPATSQVVITPDLADEATASLLLRDALGRVLNTQTVKNKQATSLSVAELPQGVYLTELWLHGKLIAVKKLVKM